MITLNSLRRKRSLGVALGSLCCLGSIGVVAWNSDWVPIDGEVTPPPSGAAASITQYDYPSEGAPSGDRGAFPEGEYTGEDEGDNIGEIPSLMDPWKDSDAADCPAPGTPMDGMPSNVPSSPIVVSLKTNDPAAYQSAIEATDLAGAEWAWLDPFLAERGCWGMLDLAYENGLQFHDGDATPTSSPLTAAYSRHDVDAVQIVLAGLFASESLTDAQKRVIALKEWQVRGWPSMKLVEVHAAHGLTPLSYEPGNPREWTVLHSAANRLETDYLRQLLEHAHGDHLPDDLLLTVVAATSDLDHANSVRAVERRQDAVATIELLRLYGYDPGDTVDWVRVESSHEGIPARVIAREQHTAREYAADAGAPAEIVDALR